MGMNYVKIHLDALLAYRRLTDTEFGRAIRCVLQYMEDGTDPNLDGKVGIMYDVLREQVDRDRKAYDKRVAAQTENGKKGGRPRKNTAHGQYPKEPNETHQNPWVFEKPNETQKTQEKEEEYIPPCIPPTASAEEIPFSGALGDAVRAWLAYKAERRESYKPTGLKSLFSQIERTVKVHGEDAVCDCIRLSMSNGWRGIIWDRIEKEVKPDGRKPEKNFGRLEEWL